MAEPKAVSKYVAEGVGTFALVFAVGCNVLGKSPPEFAVLSIASTLMVMIYCFGGVSGGHFNPAVTFAVACIKGIAPVDAVFYVASQLIGGLLAAGGYYAFFGQAFPLAPQTHWVQAFDVEFHYTFVLVFTVLNVACANVSKGNEYYGLAIAFSVVAGGYASGKISGGVFNPAVGLAIDAVSANKGFGWSLAYAAFELVGAGFAALMYRVVHPEEFNDGPKSIVSDLVSEFIGTYILCFTVGLNITVGAAPAAAVLSIAASLMVMIYALGNVSGAHFNPAVTVAILLSGRNKITPWNAFLYVSTQLFAGVLAGLSAMGAAEKAGHIGPAPGHGWAGVFVAESIFTAVLAFTVLSMATVAKPSENAFGLAIAFCVVVGGYAIGGVSGGHLNPAVSWSVDVASAVANKSAFWPCLAYSGCQLCGSMLAAGAFYTTHNNQYDAYAKSQQLA